jgi:hypothetical protein
LLVAATDGSMGLPESVSQHTSRLAELRASAGLLGAATTIFLSRPCDSPSGPAEKISWLVLAALPLPNRRPQRILLAPDAGYLGTRRRRTTLT